MDRLSSLARRHWLDALVVLAAVECALEVALRSDSPGAPSAPPWFAVPAVVLVVLPLLGHRRFPFAAPVALWLLAATISFVDGRLIVFTSGVYVAGLAASYLLGNLPDATQARIGLAVVLGGAAVVVYNDPNHSPGVLIFTPILFAIAWLTGFGLRRRAEQAEAAEERAATAERERESAARVAVAEERARIARELHDVVAHSLSVIVVQAGAERHALARESPATVAALRSIEDTGREALTEMRRLLGMLREEDEEAALRPWAGLDRLDSLLTTMRQTGLDVELEIEGERRSLPAGLDISAYRILQEALTNVLRHARATKARVLVRFQPDSVVLEVEDDGSGHAGSEVGFGLAGMRERALLFGGELHTRSTPGGGFLVTATLPVSGEGA